MSQSVVKIAYFRQTENGEDETDPICKSFVNTSMDMSSTLDEREIGERLEEKKKKNRVEISPLAITRHHLPSDAAAGLVQSGSVLVERSESGEDRVEVIVKEGKVVYTKHRGKQEESKSDE